MNFPKKLSDKLEKRRQNNAERLLTSTSGGVDFASNDYLGFAKSVALFDETHRFLRQKGYAENGVTGSRLISGNHPLYQQTESLVAAFHESESALIFNSGYDANVGFFSAVPQKGDFILFDELSHASIRDGIQLSNAKSYKFQHNDYEDLERLLERCHAERTEAASDFQMYVATEAVFSMDGDSPYLETIVALAEKYQALVIVDEAHAVGVLGGNGVGLVQEHHLQDKIFARIVTFGKALGCHGAAVLGSNLLKSYLINFARSFIYTTGLSPHAIATIYCAYKNLEQDTLALDTLKNNIIQFNREKELLGLKLLFVRSKSAIQSAIIPGNQQVRAIAEHLQEHGFDVKAILSPTVPEGQERLRICLHSYNSQDQIYGLLRQLSILL